MFSRTVGRGFLLLVTSLAAISAASAQDSDRPRRNIGSMLNVDALIDNYIRVVARKYDLTEEQTAFTERFVRQRVDQFLDRHHAELSDLVDKLFEVRGGGQISPDELVQWGRRVLPVYQDAKSIIVQANTEWRTILNDPQRVIHDEDLKLMSDSFTTTEDQLQRLITGQMTVDEFRNPRRPGASPRTVTPRSAIPMPAQPAPQTTVTPPPPAATAPPTPAPQPAPAPAPPTAVQPTPSTTVQPAPQPPTAVPPTPSTAARRPDRDRNRGTSGTSPSTAPSARPPRPAPGTAALAGRDYESQWEAYVRQFIEKYKLDADQQDRAYKILRSCQEQANSYMRSHADELDRLERRAQELQAAPNKNKDVGKEVADLNTTRTKLLEPIGQIFEKQLKPRLEKLPTRAQRDAAENPPKKPAAKK